MRMIPTGSDVGKLGLTVAPASAVGGAGDRAAGVVVTGVDPDGTASSKGIKTGDVILNVSGKTVSTPKDIREAMKAAQDGGKNNVLMRVKVRQSDPLHRAAGEGWLTRPLSGVDRDGASVGIVAPADGRTPGTDASAFVPTVPPSVPAEPPKPPHVRKRERRSKIAAPFLFLRPDLILVRYNHPCACSSSRTTATPPTIWSRPSARSAMSPTGAADGEDGPRAWRSTAQYDVLIVDRMLPKRDGLSVIGALRAQRHRDAGADPVRARPGR